MGENNRHRLELTTPHATTTRRGVSSDGQGPLAFMEGIGIQWHLDPVEVDIVGAYEGYFDRLDAQLSPSPPDNSNADAKPPPSQNRGQK